MGGIGLKEAIAALPLIAILRGVEPREAEEVGAALVEAGFSIIEVPLNSPDPFRSIELLAARFGDRALIGGGTVMTADRARRVAGAGGGLVVMPHSDPEVIRAAKDAGAWCLPGVATPTEGFAALAAGADGLKLFPAEAMPPATVKAWKAVFPPRVLLFPVGGVTPENMAAYVSAGAAGFGIGSALFAPGATPAAVGARAAGFIAAWRATEPKDAKPA
jgi:2-dehydro-3-deoxyphosphogalactonate aldolase